jgi:hypothetical protein
MAAVRNVHGILSEKSTGNGFRCGWRITFKLTLNL